MHKISIEQAIEQIVKEHPRYHREAYDFVREALDFTVKQQKKTSPGRSRHISGKELLEGLREFALQEFGPLAQTVLNYWNLKCCEDIGQVVYDMVSASILKTNETDSLDDFKNGYNFEQAFRQPFEPRGRFAQPPSAHSSELSSSQSA